MLGYIAATILSLPWAEQVALAKADFAAYGPAARYLDVGVWKAEQQPDALDAWRFFYPHLDRGLSLSHQFTRLSRTDLIRVDIDALGWTKKGWSEALKGYPYSEYIHDRQQPQDLLIVRLDWLMRATGDMTFLASGKPSEAYYRLLFGGENPKTKAEFLKLLGIVEKTTGLEQAQVIEAGKSGVAFNRRMISFHPSDRDYWQTFDSKRASGDQDPTLGRGNFKFDAQEIIVPLEKTLARGRVRVQAYALTDGSAEGKIVAFADNDVVEDSRHTLGRFSVRTNATCIACHAGALNGSNSNLFVEYKQLEGKPYINFKSPAEAEKFNGEFLGSIGKVVTRANQDHAEFCLDFVGREPRDAIANWLAFLDQYDEPLDLAQAARESHCEPETLRLSLAYLSGIQDADSKERYFDASVLANNGQVTRKAWEDSVYLQSIEALNAWRAH